MDLVWHMIIKYFHIYEMNEFFDYQGKDIFEVVHQKYQKLKKIVSYSISWSIAKNI